MGVVGRKAGGKLRRVDVVLGVLFVDGEWSIFDAILFVVLYRERALMGTFHLYQVIFAFTNNIPSHLLA